MHAKARGKEAAKEGASTWRAWTESKNSPPSPSSHPPPTIISWSPIFHFFFSPTTISFSSGAPHTQDKVFLSSRCIHIATIYTFCCCFCVALYCCDESRSAHIPHTRTHSLAHQSYKIVCRLNANKRIHFSSYIPLLNFASSGVHASDRRYSPHSLPPSLPPFLPYLGIEAACTCTPPALPSAAAPPPEMSSSSSSSPPSPSPSGIFSLNNPNF